MYELRRALGSVTLSLCTGTLWDTKIRVYKKSGDKGIGDCVVGNDDSCDLQSSVTFIADVSEIYRVWVQ